MPIPGFRDLNASHLYPYDMVYPPPPRLYTRPGRWRSMRYYLEILMVRPVLYSLSCCTHLSMNIYTYGTWYPPLPHCTSPPFHILPTSPSLYSSRQMAQHELSLEMLMVRPLGLAWCDADLVAQEETGVAERYTRFTSLSTACRVTSPSRLCMEDKIICLNPCPVRTVCNSLHISIVDQNNFHKTDHKIYDNYLQFATHFQSSSPTTSGELRQQFATCSGWRR